MRQRRAIYENDPQQVLNILKQGAEKANAVAYQTLGEVKQRIKQRY